MPDTTNSLALRDLARDIRDLARDIREVKDLLLGIRSEAILHRRETFYQLRGVCQHKERSRWRDTFDYTIVVRLGALVALMAGGLGLAESLKLVGPF